MFVDEVYLTLKAGRGGAGKVAFFPGRKTSPAGGNGGRGGSIYVQAVTDMPSLTRYAGKNVLAAPDGGPGMGFRRHGAKGEDLILEFPVGTTFIDQKTRTAIELETPEQRILLCKGGRGGRGNDEFKSSTNISPHQCEKGFPGEEKRFQIIMKLIAEYGLIGLPNAGKSSLLNELTRANVKTASYPFTTLEPNLGVVNGHIIADIPGLIEGASEGKGLGIKFLRHIEKVRILLHCVAADSEDVVGIYKVVRQELQKYSEILANKDELVLLTKRDLVDEKILQQKKQLLESVASHILPVSIHDYESLQILRKKIAVK